MVQSVSGKASRATSLGDTGSFSINVKASSILSPRADPHDPMFIEPEVPQLSFLENHRRRVMSASGVRKPARLSIGTRPMPPLSARLPEIPSMTNVSQWPTTVTGATLTLDLTSMTRTVEIKQPAPDALQEAGGFPAWYTPRGVDLQSAEQPTDTGKPLLVKDSMPQRVPVPPQVNTPKREDPSRRCTHDSETSREQPSFVSRKHLSDAKMLAQASRRAGKVRFEGIAYYKMGVLHDNLKEYKKAISQYKKFLAICVRTNDTVGEALAYNCIAVDYQNMGGKGNLKKSIEYHNKHRNIADVSGKFTCYSNLGLAHQGLGNLDQAVQNHQNALRHAIHLSSLEGESVACANLGLTGAANGEILTARACAQRHLQLATSMQDMKAESTAYQQLGSLAIAEENYEGAAVEFEKALQISSGDIVNGSNAAKSARCAIGLARGNELLQQHLKSAADQLVAR